MKRIDCKGCSRKLEKAEVALSRKLINKDIEEFLCIDCLSEYFGCSVEDLQIKIEEFKEQGCTLFL